MRKDGKKLVWRMLVLGIASISIVYFWTEFYLITGLLIILSILVNIFSTKLEILFFIVVAVLATLIESLTVSTGAWVYSEIHLLNFPIWLPLYWGIGGVIIKDVYILNMTIGRGSSPPQLQDCS
jgi:hypothetical protein